MHDYKLSKNVAYLYFLYTQYTFRLIHRRNRLGRITTVKKSGADKDDKL